MSCISLTELNDDDRAAIKTHHADHPSSNVAERILRNGIVSPHHATNHASALRTDADSHIMDGANTVSEGPAERLVDLGNGQLMLVPIARPGQIIELPDLGIAPDGPSAPWLGGIIEWGAMAAAVVGLGLVMGIAVGWL